MTSRPCLIPNRTTMRALLGAVALLGATACQTVPPAAETAPPKLPPLPPLATVNATHYSINSARSDVRFLVYRGGPLASFGHNHLISAGSVDGAILLNADFDKSGFELALPVKDFQVDPPAMRKVEGVAFSAHPSAQAIAGTAKNMLGAAVLDAEEYPTVRIRSIRITGPRWDPDITVRITLHGVARDRTIPVALFEDGTRIIAIGTFEFRQSEFGIKPFSILGGGLQVQDRVKVRFRIVADKG